MLTLDNPLGFQGTISGLATGDVLNLFGGINISGASTDGSTLTISGSTPLTYQVTGVAAGTPFNVLSTDKIVALPTTGAVFSVTGQSAPYLLKAAEAP